MAPKTHPTGGAPLTRETLEARGFRRLELLIPEDVYADVMVLAESERAGSGTERPVDRCRQPAIFRAIRAEAARARRSSKKVARIA